MFGYGLCLYVFLLILCMYRLMASFSLWLCFSLDYISLLSNLFIMTLDIHVFLVILAFKVLLSYHLFWVSIFCHVYESGIFIWFSSNCIPLHHSFVHGCLSLSLSLSSSFLPSISKIFGWALNYIDRILCIYVLPYFYFLKIGFLSRCYLLLFYIVR